VCHSQISRAPTIAMHSGAVNLVPQLQMNGFLVLIELACDVRFHQVSYVALARYADNALVP
jgi:hypothetical protein